MKRKKYSDIYLYSKGFLIAIQKALFKHFEDWFLQEVS